MLRVLRHGGILEPDDEKELDLPGQKPRWLTLTQSPVGRQTPGP